MNPPPRLCPAAIAAAGLQRIALNAALNQPTSPSAVANLLRKNPPQPTRKP